MDMLKSCVGILASLLVAVVAPCICVKNSIILWCFSAREQLKHHKATLMAKQGRNMLLM